MYSSNQMWQHWDLEAKLQLCISPCQNFQETKSTPHDFLQFPFKCQDSPRHRKVPASLHLLYLCHPILLCNSWKQFSAVSPCEVASRLARHGCWTWHIALAALVIEPGQYRSHYCLVDMLGESQPAQLQFLLRTPLAPEYDNPQPEQHSS